MDLQQITMEPENIQGEARAALAGYRRRRPKPAASATPQETADGDR